MNSSNADRKVTLFRSLIIFLTICTLNSSILTEKTNKSTLYI